MDDIVSFGPNLKQHITYVGTGFDILKLAGVTLDLEKFVLFNDETDYFRKVIQTTN